MNRLGPRILRPYIGLLTRRDRPCSSATGNRETLDSWLFSVGRERLNLAKCVMPCLVRGARASRLPAAASRRSLFLFVRWARRQMQHPGRARSPDLGPIPSSTDLFSEFTGLHPLKTAKNELKRGGDAASAIQEAESRLSQEGLGIVTFSRTCRLVRAGFLVWFV